MGDVKLFAAAMVQLMSDYPAYVLADVVSPRSGLPVQCKWMPSMAEVKAACEESAARHAMARREAEQRRQAASDRCARPCDPERAAAILRAVSDELRRKAAEAGLGDAE
ncbi:hypothetical protein ACFFJB_14755 [Camelimonas abortus]|uniref:Pyocin activator protein PrtN n=1 Tax=Camelimonas abortus TaxID=1017184 RepID=A0ABV7LHP4_9HYPH